MAGVTGGGAALVLGGVTAAGMSSFSGSVLYITLPLFVPFDCNTHQNMTDFMTVRLQIVDFWVVAPANVSEEPAASVFRIELL